MPLELSIGLSFPITLGFIGQEGMAARGCSTVAKVKQTMMIAPVL
jgi:hypothetical protein